MRLIDSTEAEQANSDRDSSSSAVSRSSTSEPAKVSRPAQDSAGVASGSWARRKRLSSSSTARPLKAASAAHGSPSTAVRDEHREAGVEALEISGRYDGGERVGGRGHNPIVTTVDARGLACPLPLTMAKRRMAELRAG